MQEVFIGLQPFIDDLEIGLVQSRPKYGLPEKKKEFHWLLNVAKTFREIKQMMTETPVMRLPDFSKVFEITCDALRLA